MEHVVFALSQEQQLIVVQHQSLTTKKQLHTKNEVIILSTKMKHRKEGTKMKERRAGKELRAYHRSTSRGSQKKGYH